MKAAKRIRENRLLYIVLLVFLSRVLMYLIFHGYAWYTGLKKGFVLGIAFPWDNGWYHLIATSGYDLEPSHHPKGDAASWAFFPLDPICIRVVSKIFRISAWKAGMFNNTIFLIIALFYADKYIMLTRNNRKISNAFIVLMTFGPYTFYFSTLYTESMYLMFTMMTFYYMTKKEYIPMGISGALLSATRSTGVMIVFSVAVYYLISEHKKKRKWTTVFVDAFTDCELVLGVSMIPMGLFAYMSYLWKLTGDPWAFMRIQKAWGRIDVPFFKLLQQFLFSEDKSNLYFVGFAFFSVVVICYGIWKKRDHEIVMPAVILGIQCRGSFLCIPRYMLSTGMFWILAVEFVENHCAEWVKRVIMITLAVISLIFLILWYQQNAFCI